jgi:hypothetical protein
MLRQLVLDLAIPAGLTIAVICILILSYAADGRVSRTVAAAVSAVGFIALPPLLQWISPGKWMAGYANGVGVAALVAVIYAMLSRTRWGTATGKMTVGSVFGTLLGLAGALVLVALLGRSAYSYIGVFASALLAVGVLASLGRLPAQGRWGAASPDPAVERQVGAP